MKFMGFVPVLVLFFAPYFAHANASHLGSMSLDLSLTDAKGKSKKVSSLNGEFRLDWKAHQCEVKVKDLYFYCKLDRSKELKDQTGKVLVRELPISVFSADAIDAMLARLSQDSDEFKSEIALIASETRSQRQNGFEVPFYTCESCAPMNGKTTVWNAFDSFVQRSLDLQTARVAGKTLSLKLKLKGMIPVKGAFNIIGRENADSYIPSASPASQSN